MSEIFSNERLIDYFLIFDVDILSLSINDNAEVFDRLGQHGAIFDQLPLNVQYEYNTLKMYPKKIDDNQPYDLNLKSIYNMFPKEHVYLKKPLNEFFSLMFTNCNFIYQYNNILF
jgi:hypothetical protein